MKQNIPNPKQRWMGKPSVLSITDLRFPARRGALAADAWEKKSAKPFTAPRCLGLLSKIWCLVSTSKQQHCLKQAEKKKSNTLLQATF